MIHLLTSINDHHIETKPLSYSFMQTVLFYVKAIFPANSERASAVQRTLRVELFVHHIERGLCNGFGDLDHNTI